MEQPIVIGVEDLYFATLTSETKTDGAWITVYGEPKPLAQTIELTLTPKISQGRLAASNRNARMVDRITGYTVSFHADAISLPNRAELTGRQIDDNGGMAVRYGGDTPFVAIGFKGEKDESGAAEYVWLYKGKFAEFEKKYKSADPNGAIEYQTPTITGEFVARKDGEIAYWLDEETATTAGKAVIAGWFEEVVEPGTITPAP